MKDMNRRNFISSAIIASVAPAILGSMPAMSTPATQEESSMLLGVIANGSNPEENLKIVRDLGFPSCQLNITGIICSGPNHTLRDLLIKKDRTMVMKP
jgi:hypothetical protein